MSRVFEGESFSDFYDEDSAAVFEALEFRRCQFTSSRISMTRQPRLRSTVRRIRLINCEQRGCALEAATVEDVLVDGFKTNGILQAWAAVFKHVTLRGKIGSIMASDKVKSGLATPEEQRGFDEANAVYYSNVDWALDIREAEFADEPDFRGVPARLVRRDPETQVVVTRAKAMQGAWRTVDLSKTSWATAIEFLLEFGYPDVVLVAPKRHRKFREFLDGLKKLRDVGVAEPD